VDAELCFVPSPRVPSLLLQFQHTGGTQDVDFQLLFVAFPNDNNRVSRKLDHVPAVSMNNL
jgi:hypothetical protein